MHFPLRPLLQDATAGDAVPPAANLIRLEMGLCGFGQGMGKETSFQQEWSDAGLNSISIQSVR